MSELQRNHALCGFQYIWAKRRIINLKIQIRKTLFMLKETLVSEIAPETIS